MDLEKSYQCMQLNALIDIDKTHHPNMLNNPPKNSY